MKEDNFHITLTPSLSHSLISLSLLQRHLDGVDMNRGGAVGGSGDGGEAVYDTVFTADDQLACTHTHPPHPSLSLSPKQNNEKEVSVA